MSKKLEGIIDAVQCPKCNGESYVIDSRDTYNARRRRRKCTECKHRYTTYEIHAEEYDRIQSLQVNTAKFDSVIATLREIKVQFGEFNGHKESKT